MNCVLSSHTHKKHTEGAFTIQLLYVIKTYRNYVWDKKYVELVFNPVELATNLYVKTEGTGSYLVSFLISYLQRTDKRRRGNKRRSTHPMAKPACSALKPLSTCSSRKTVKRRVAPSHRLTVLIKVWKQPHECLSYVCPTLCIWSRIYIKVHMLHVVFFSRIRHWEMNSCFIPKICVI